MAGFEQSVVRPRSTALNVYELLRGEIVLGILKPLQPIREAVISERLSISRTPVREALLRLANLGLVDIYPQSGTVVAPIRVAKVRGSAFVGAWAVLRTALIFLIVPPLVSDADGRGWHDKACRTIVLRAR